ncbi:MAG: binding-protein-dependent transport system inner rane component [Paenibacillaceae bacterium]|jgi:putative aldouronate transport system permease protein|nr:binding-protein-dependent transport system inner rane component [Paenibacillaceae bacterium]
MSIRMQEQAGELPAAAATLKRRYPLLNRIRNNWDIYLIILPPLIALLLYNYVPMLGIVIAFKDYKVFDGIMGSRWIGLEHFRTLFTDPKFYDVLSNTLLLNLYKFIFQFPLPILLALFLNELRGRLVKRTVQTLTYLPHFLSWVVIAGIFIDILSPSTGIVNSVVKFFGGSPITFIGDESYFRSVLITATAWKETGWGAVIYLAALTAIDPELYAAASVDGAGKLRQTWHITLPGIAGTIVFIIILRVASSLTSDVEQVLLFYSPLVYNVGDVIGTYVYREGILNSAYSYTTAVGLFVSIVGLILMVTANKISHKFTNKGIW